MLCELSVQHPPPGLVPSGESQSHLLSWDTCPDPPPPVRSHQSTAHWAKSNPQLSNKLLPQRTNHPARVAPEPATQHRECSLQFIGNGNILGKEGRTHTEGKGGGDMEQEERGGKRGFIHVCHKKCTTHQGRQSSPSCQAATGARTPTASPPNPQVGPGAGTSWVGGTQFIPLQDTGAGLREAGLLPGGERRCFFPCQPSGLRISLPKI